MTWKFKQVVCCLLCANKNPVGERPLQSADCTHQWAWPGAVFGCFLLAQGQKWISPHSRLSAWAPHRWCRWSLAGKFCAGPTLWRLLSSQTICTARALSTSLACVGVTQSWVHLLCFPLSLSKMALGSLKHP